MPLHLDEPVGIDPRVDVVFLALFGSPEHERVLVAFLNAVLSPETPIARARCTNPVHPSQFQGQKSVVLDIEAVDEAGRTLQVEMQRKAHRGVRQRMLHDWSRLYSGQLERGQPYSGLRPVVSVWVCEDDPFPESSLAHLRFEVRERVEGRVLHEDLRVDVLQLSRWSAGSPDLVGSPLAAWFQFFNEAPAWREVPPMVDTPAIEEAMTILNEFRTDVALNALYRGRIVAERLEAQRQLDEAEVQAIRDALAKERAEKEAERTEKEAERAAKEAALAQIAELKKRLGLDEA